MDAVKRFKRGRGGRPSFLDRTAEEDDSFPVATESFKQSAGQSGGKKRPVERSKKRVLKVLIAKAVILKLVLWTVYVAKAGIVDSDIALQLM